MRKAYLVVHLDTKQSPPRFTEASIYSEPAYSLTGGIGKGYFALDVLEAPGEDYEDAVKMIHLQLTMQPYCQVFDWLRPLLREEDKPKEWCSPE